MTAPAQQCQPDKIELRQAQPVCCYCDSDLSCAQCGREQPYDDVSALQAHVEELTKAMQELSRQKTSDEIGREGEIDPDECDFVAAYDTLILVARRALSMPLEQEKSHG